MKTTPLLGLFLLWAAIRCPASSTSAAGGDESRALRYVVVLDSTPAGLPFKPAAEGLAQLRGAFAIVPLTKTGLDQVFDHLRELKPASVGFVVPPGRIEDDFVGDVFEEASRLVEGPELDFAYGFITGATPEDALALVRNTADAEKQRATISKRFVAVGQTFQEADLGPFAYQQALLHENYGYRSWPINPIDGSVEWESRLRWEMRQLDGASLVFFAGHGMGDRMCGIDAAAFTDFRLDHAIIVSGPCHSAVTTLRHDVLPGSMGIKSVAVPSGRSICLRLIKAGAVAQIASTASSSWGNVGPVVGGFFNEAKTVGEALRDRLNDHIRQKGVRSFHILPFEEGKPSPQFLHDDRNPGEIQSLARVVLIGDPAYRPFLKPRPVLPVPPIEDRQHKMVIGPAPGAPLAAPQPRTDLAKASVAELIAALNQAPTPEFKELNELIRRGEAAVPPLIEALRTSDSWQVPKALGALKDKRAAGPLIEALAKHSWSPYQEVAVEALELITGQKLGTDAAAWRKLKL